MSEYENQGPGSDDDDLSLAPPTPGDPSDIRPAADASVIDRAASGEDIDDGEMIDALDWLLAEEGDPDLDPIPTKPCEINVGTEDKPRWVRWVVTAIPEEEIKQIRRLASGENRQARRGNSTGKWDQDEFNLRVVAAATTDPDPMQLARKRSIADPATALRVRFRRKWGLITLLAGEIVALSGMDDAAVRDAKEVVASGN